MCDGNNSTPDLRNRFVIGSGAGSSYPVNQTGGSADAILVSHTHNLQNHVHGVNLTTGNQSASHNHTFSGSGSGSHSHGIPKGRGGSQASISHYVANTTVEQVQGTFATTSSTVNISISGTSGDNSGNHNHT